MDFNQHQQREQVRRMLRRGHRIAERHVAHILHREYGATDRPVINPYTNRPSGLMGLGAGSDTPIIEQGISTAASFVPIPGFGQAVAAIEMILNNVFGWGDSTPMYTLNQAVVELRLQLAEAHRASGIPDTFDIPAGLDTTNQGEIETLSLAIVNDVLHKVPSIHLSDDTSLQVQHDQLGPKLWPAYVHEERADLYKTIAALKTAVGSASMTAANDQLNAPPPASPSATPWQAGSPSGVPSQTGVSSDSNAPATAQPTSGVAGDMPYILFGAGFLLLLVMAGKGKSDG